MDVKILSCSSETRHATGGHHLLHKVCREHWSSCCARAVVVMENMCAVYRIPQDHGGTHIPAMVVKSTAAGALLGAHELDHSNRLGEG